MLQLAALLPQRAVALMKLGLVAVTQALVALPQRRALAARLG